MRGAGGFFVALEAIKRGEMQAYPIYCALLYTAEEGLDEKIARYVSESFGELDAMTSEDCLVFVVDDVNADWLPGQSGEQHAMPPLNRSDVYRLAEELGIPPSPLPCAAFFIRPSAKELLTLPLNVYVPTDTTGVPAIVPTFRAIASATRTCAKKPRDDRLKCLDVALKRERKAMRARRSVQDVVGEVGETAGSINKIRDAGMSIAMVIAAFFGIHIPLK